MSVMLCHSNRVHRPEEKRGDEHPMVERRSVDLLSEKSGHKEGYGDLDERFHGGTLA